MGWMVDRDRYRDRIGGVEGRTRKEMDMGGTRTGSRTRTPTTLLNRPRDAAADA
jgi:hypothetical protein